MKPALLLPVPLSPVGRAFGRAQHGWPEEIRFSDALAKTRSGKIMRRLLREIVTSHTVTGDVTTLEDLSVVMTN